MISRASELALAVVVSARSRETENEWPANLAVDSGAGHMEIGSATRSERLRKWGRIMRLGWSPDMLSSLGTDGLRQLEEMR